MNAFAAELFRMQAQVLETTLAVQLAQDAQHLAARQATQITDPVETASSPWPRRTGTEDSNAS
jgi:hypothetical protein